ncbi:uncharacterized protein B0I36DRAFT_348423 [Microdochium trichocladiopsis]|uniref:ubiquitinyl hydrolase 1 n=1 Tax=Microdochium trichocladiopsis TaxID=1682393 RepID=A0A9P9BRW2_9PEZI|nr:uncharacterized protein B0I36DRAFT_348423 [Microdochium trichocladiopsis]KAH7033356.1 hypothetical protein B0I36DRAFT_348423 [Microdochium trichocladiopsis]
MSGYAPQRHQDRAVLSRTYYREDAIASASVWDRLQQPSVLVPLILFILGIFYNSLHKSPLHRHRHPGEVLWDFIVTATPASLLYSLDDWLHPPLAPALKPSTTAARSQTYTAKSDALRRILGLDKPGSIIKTVASAGLKGMNTLSTASFMGKHTGSKSPPGLTNISQSCFQNSILQGLSTSSFLPDYLEKASSCIAGTSVDGASGPTTTLRIFLASLVDPGNNGRSLTAPEALRSLNIWDQQDAQEYFSKLLEGIDNEVKEAAHVLSRHKYPDLALPAVRDDTGGSSRRSIDSGYQSLSAAPRTATADQLPVNPLEGLEAHRLACVECGFSEGLTLQPSNCLTLNLGHASEYDIFRGLDSHVQVEAIEGVQCPKCTLLKLQRLLKLIVTRGVDAGLSDEALREPRTRLAAVETALEEDDFEDETLTEKCKITSEHRVRTTKMKQTVFARPPQTLALHMNRSVYSERATLKNPAPVRFPSILDLGPWVLGSGGDSLPDPQGSGSDDSSRSPPPASDVEYWTCRPKFSIVPGSRGRSKMSGPIYELRAVVIHQGHHSNGHYVCYKKHTGRSAGADQDGAAESSVSQPSGGTLSTASTKESSALPLDDDNDDDDDAAEGNMTKWWRISDENVWEVEEADVLNQSGVFMLFYDCVDSKTVFISETETGEGESKDQVPCAPEEPTERPSAPPHSSSSVRPSSLLPLLAEDENVDSSIPLGRPNS